METKKLTAKIGNWQETVAMQKLLNGQVYDPRIKASGTLTKMRVIAHDEHLDSKDYKTTLNDCQPPQQHKDYVTSDEKGPRQRRMEAVIAARINQEEKDRESDTAQVNNQRLMVTTNKADFHGQSFAGSKLGEGAGSRVTAAQLPRDPYYVKDAAITYYLHTALHGNQFDFPATPIGDLDRIWLKGTSFTQGTTSGGGRKSETYENSAVPPTVRELQLLKKLRFDIVHQCAQISPEGCPGGAVQTLTQKLLDLDSPSGRAPLEAISSVISLLTGVDMTPQQSDAAGVAFSRNNDERLILIEFIEYLRGSLSARSRALVFMVWDLCNPSGAEFISEQELASGLNESCSRDAADSLLDSLHLYSCGREGGYDVVDLIELYRDVYAEVGDEEGFEALLKETWRL